MEARSAMMDPMVQGGVRDRLVTRTRLRARRGSWWPVLVVCLVLSGCTDDPSPDSPSEEPETALEVRIVSCAGRIDDDARTAVETDIGDLLSTYVVEAFLGTYPRDDFVRALDVFTSGAAERAAAADLDVLTASRFATARKVTATRLGARISCVAHDGAVLGATVRVAFAFEAVDESGQTRPFSLRGRLMVADQGGAWVVFGYDVSRDDASVGAVS